MIEGHLRGEDRVRPNRRNTGFVAGVYPLLFDDTCQFLAVDFDKRDWSVDALAFLDACRQFEIPCSTPFGLWFSAVCGHYGRPIEPHGLSGRICREACADAAAYVASCAALFSPALGGALPRRIEPRISTSCGWLLGSRCWLTGLGPTSSWDVSRISTRSIRLRSIGRLP